MQDIESIKNSASSDLMFVSGYVYRLLRHEARSIGISWTALMVMKDLDLLGPLSQKNLAEIEQVRPATMSVLLADMVQKKWVKRKESDEDARINLVHLTSKGKAELTKAGRKLQKCMNAELEGLPKHVLQSIHNGLGPICKRFAICNN